MKARPDVTQVFVTVDDVPLDFVPLLKAHIEELLEGPDRWGDFDASVTMRLYLTDEQIERLQHYFQHHLTEHSGQVQPRFVKPQEVDAA